MFGWEWKNEGMKKVSLYKFMYTPLLKNDAQLKPKNVIVRTGFESPAQKMDGLRPKKPKIMNL